MPSIERVIQSGLGNPWLLLPTALVLGALHALEPGHSKSMMTAFIVAVQGTARQAILLGLAATVGHTMVVWALALLAWRLGDTGILDRAEPWLLLLGGLLLIWLSIRMLLHLLPGHRQAAHHHGLHGHSDAHGQGHNHSHPRHYEHDHGHRHEHHHDHTLGAHVPEDAHAAAHQAEIQYRYSGGGRVSDSEVLWFGFTGGLLPCPAAFAVLLACLHQKAYALGVVMIAAFSIGLAVMLVTVGVAAAWGASALRARMGMVERLSARGPYASAGIVLVIGLFTAIQGARAMMPT